MSSVAALFETALLSARTPRDWLAEARAHLAGLATPPRILHAPTNVRDWAAQWQAWATAEAMRQADLILIHGTQRAQRERRFGYNDAEYPSSYQALRYGAVNAEQVHDAAYRAPEVLRAHGTPSAITYALALGPARTLLSALKGAAKRNPPNPYGRPALWASKGNSGVWRSHGEQPNERAARRMLQGPHPTPQGCRGRERDGLAR